MLPPGEFLVDFAVIPDYSGYFAAVLLHPKVTLRGQGEAATVLKLSPGHAPVAGSYAIVSNSNLNGGDENMSVENLTIDGDGASQTLLHSGISFNRARFVKTVGVTVKNLYGTAAFPPGETFHFVSTNCADVTEIGCRALGTAGTQGTGFGSNRCTGVTRTACLADGMSEGMGFADWNTRGVLMGECIAQRNGTNGFNVEYCEDYILNGCRAGGRASDGATQYPWEVDESLGNVATGITVNASKKVQLNGVISRLNAGGLAVVPTGADESEVTVSGGDYSDNTTNQIYFGSVASARASRISSQTRVGSTPHPFALNGGLGNISTATTLSPVPAIAASGVDVYNDFPFAVTVYIVGGTITLVHLNGNNTGNGNRRVDLSPGETIRITYTIAPTWIWQRR